MSTEIRPAIARSPDGLFRWDPDWDAVDEYPIRIPCNEQDYLAIDSNLLLEYDGGCLVVLPMPTIFHQLILKYVCWQLDAHVVAGAIGTVVLAPYKVQVARGKYREPDILFIKAEHARWIGKDACKKADLVIEIVSENNRSHDLVTKRDEYARAGIPEYWIIDPEEEAITVFALRPRRKTYDVHGVFRKGERAESRVLPGFGVDVRTALEQEPGAPR